MGNTNIRYDRKLDEKHLVHFKEGGLLNFLVAEPIVPDQKKYFGLTEFDVQIREKNNVAVYCGLTKILNINFYQSGNVPFIFNADSDTYKKQSCFPKIEDYTNQKLIQNSVNDYFKQVVVGDNWWKKEGIVQTQYLSICARKWNDNVPAAIFDKEVVFSYLNDAIKKDYTEKHKEQVNSIKQKLAKSIGRNWKEIKDTKSDELDLMGISSKGDELFLIEAKADNASAEQIYYSPFQLLYYVLQLKEALGDNSTIIENINEFINQKKAITLLPADFPQLTEVKKIIPVLAVKKKLWSDEVQNRLMSTIRFIKPYSKNSMSNFEIWEIENGKIKRKKAD